MVDGVAVTGGRGIWTRFGQGDVVGCGVDFTTEEVTPAV
jgi:hypothetical protein